MARLARDAVILSKAESSYGTDSTPGASTDALQVRGLNLDPLNSANVKRDFYRAFLGGAEELVGDRHIGYQYGCELVGSGTAGAAPAWASQLLACGMAETLVASTRADYTLLTSSHGSKTDYIHDSGVKHLATGVRGNVSIVLEQGQLPMLEFSFLGIYNAETATAQPTPTLTAWKQPQIVNNANSADVVLGCTHSTSGAPALVSGTTYSSKGIRINLGNQVNYTALLGDEEVVIADREVTGSITLKVAAADEVTLMAQVLAGTLTSIGFVHGTVTGRKVLVFMPYCQLVRPRLAEDGGKRLLTLDFRATPSVGNDELRLVTSF